MQKHAYRVHSTAFVLMILSSAGLYFAARAGSSGWIFVLLGLFIMGNVLLLGNRG
jgi:hypothetical protein